MSTNIIQKETIIDAHKKPITIDFTICEENESRIFYMQPVTKARKDVEFDDLQGFMKDTLVQILIKFHHHDQDLMKKKTKSVLIENICRLHCIAITFDADKLNISFNKKQEIATKIRSNSDQILILLKECLEQDDLYCEIPQLLSTYERLCSDEKLMQLFEECVVSIFLHFVEQWLESKSETDFLQRYRLFQRNLNKTNHIKMYKIDVIKEIFAQESISMAWNEFIYGIIILVKKLTIKLVRLILGDYLIGIYDSKHKTFQEEFSGDELKYFGTCFLGSSVTSYLRTVHGIYKRDKHDALLILNRMLIKYKTIDELEKHEVPIKAIKENDGHLRMVKAEFVDWGIELLNITSVELKKALITNSSLDKVIKSCQSDKMLQKFLLIFDAMDVMDDKEEEVDNVALNFSLIKKIGTVLSRKVCTRMVWAMIKDKKNDKVVDKFKKEAKLLHLSNKRLELCKNT